MKVIYNTVITNLKTKKHIMERLVTFEQFAEQKAKKDQVQLEEELNAKREASANSFKDLLSEFGVTSMSELSEEDKPKFNERLGTLTESALLLEGTRSQVGKIDKKGRITSVYVHYDGYPDHMVPMIKNYDKKGVDQLVKLGKSGISYLDKNIGKKQDFNSPVRGTTLFYGRDRGENKDMTTTWTNAADIKGYFKEVANDGGAEYVYLYDERDGKWYMGDTYGSPVLQVVESVNEAVIAISGKRTAKKVALRLTRLFDTKLTALAADKVTMLGFLKELYFYAMEDANFSREANVTMNMIKGKISPLEVKVEGLDGEVIRISAKTIKTIADKYYSDLANAGDWSGIGITEGFAMYLDQIGESNMAQALLDSFNAQFEGEEKRVSRTEKLYELSQRLESTNEAKESVNEAKYDKKKLLKLIKNHDDAEILVNGKWYIIYNPDNGNDENTDMWNDDSVFALDQDGEEFEINYKDIEHFKESVEVNETEIKSDDEFKEYAFTILQKAFGADFDEAKAQEVVDGILGKVDGDYGKAAGILQSSLG